MSENTKDEVAEAREDRRELISEIRRLREENERLREENERLREENERLREENEWLRGGLSDCAGHLHGGLEESQEIARRTLDTVDALRARTQGCPPGAIVVRDDDETRTTIAQALMTRAAWNPKTLSELDKSPHSCLQLAAMSLRADADAVLDALREAYQRGEQDSRGNPMPCLHLDEAAAVVAALREAYQRGEQDSGNTTPCLHPDSIEERQNATDAEVRR